MKTRIYAVPVVKGLSLANQFPLVDDFLLEKGAAQKTWAENTIGSPGVVLMLACRQQTNTGSMSRVGWETSAA